MLICAFDHSAGQLSACLNNHLVQKRSPVQRPLRLVSYAGRMGITSSKEGTATRVLRSRKRVVEQRAALLTLKSLGSW